MISRRLEGSGSRSSQGSRRLYPYADVLLPLLTADIDAGRSFCVEVPLPVLQKSNGQIRPSVRQRTDGPPPPLQRGRYIPDPSQARLRSPSQQTQDNPRRQVRCRPRVTCLICLETLDHTDVWIRPTAHCTHGPVICASCFRQYIIYKVEVEGSATLICPDLGCRRVLGHEDVVSHIKDNMICLNR